MITIPTVLTYKDIAVYPDDKDCNLYYCIKTTPVLRTVDGNPVFNGLFWADTADGQMKSIAGLAGGQVNFDVNLGIPEEDQDAIRNELKRSGIQASRYKEAAKKEKERQTMKLKATMMGDAKGNGGQGKASRAYPSPGGEPAREKEQGQEKKLDIDLSDIPTEGEIRFGSINFTDGLMEVLEQTNGSLVDWCSDGGKPSMFGDNNAAFAATLTPEGAAVWYKALKEDAKAIGVRFNLKFQIRLPSLEIRAYAGSHQRETVTHIIKQVERKYNAGCDKIKTKIVNIKSITRDLVDNGLINIEIKTGSTNLSQDYISEIRESVMGILTNKIEEIIKSRLEGLTEEQREDYLLESMTEEINSFVELSFTQEDIVEWSIAPQGTIMGFLEDVSPAARQRATTLIDLSEKEKDTTKIHVKVQAPWDEAPYITNVKVDMHYISNGKEESHIFTKDENSWDWMFRTPEHDNGKVKYSVYAYMKGFSEPYKIDEDIATRTIDVHIGKIGVIDLNFRPHPNLASLSGRNKVTAAQVYVEYKDKSGKNNIKETLVLNPEQPEGVVFHKELGTDIDSPVKYKVQYYFKQSEMLEMPEQHYYITKDQNVVYTNFPFQDSINVNVGLPLVPTDMVKKAYVEFKYEDKMNGFESNDLVFLSKEDGWENPTARLMVMDKTKGDYKYRFRVICEEDIIKSNWLNGDNAEFIALPIQKIMVSGKMLGLGSDFIGGTALIQNEESGFNKTIFFTEDNGQGFIEFYTQSIEGKLPEFKYLLTMYDLTGVSHEISGSWKGAMFMFPKPNKTTA